MARTVILEFEDDSEAEAFVSNLNARGYLYTTDAHDIMRPAHPEVSGVYKEIYAIEGKEDERFKVED